MRKFAVTVRMIRSYHDFFLRKPSHDDVLEALAEMINLKMLDDLFDIEIEEKG